MAFSLLNTEQVKSLSFGARSTYYCVLSLVSPNRRFVDSDIKIFDVVPTSTFYRHKKEIFEKTGLDLNKLFPATKPQLS